MKLYEFAKLMVADQTVVLYDRFNRKIEECYPSEIIARYLRAEVRSIYASENIVHITLSYGSFE